MEWWFKSEKYSVNSDTISNLQESLKTMLRQANNLSVANLYDDKQFFYIKTSNKISLNHFFFQNGFEELEDGKPTSDLSLLYGA